MLLAGRQGRGKGVTTARGFDRYLSQHVMPFNFRVSLLCGDHARQFEKGPLADFCLQNNIAQLFSASNRYGRTHTEDARALLVHARLPLEYWQFAMAMAVYMSERRQHGFPVLLLGTFLRCFHRASRSGASGAARPTCPSRIRSGPLADGP